MVIFDDMEKGEEIYVNSDNEICTYKKDDSFVKYVREDVVDKKINEMYNQLRRAEKEVDNLSMKIYAKY